MVRTGRRASFLSLPLFRWLMLVFSPCLFGIILFVSYSDVFLTIVPLTSQICGRIFLREPLLWLLLGSGWGKAICIMHHCSLPLVGRETGPQQKPSFLATHSELADFCGPPPHPASRPQKFPCMLPQKTACHTVPPLDDKLILTLPGNSPFFAVISVNLMVC